MASQPPAKISYINKSYQDERNELLARAPIVSNGTWTDLNNAELLVALTELMLGDSDMNRFYLDHQANEAFLETARERKNVISHCNQISYRVKSWSPAQGTVSLKLSNIQAGYVSIPRHTKFWASTGLQYCSFQDIFLSNGNPFADLFLLQCDILSVMYISNGTLNQKYIINSSNIGEQTISVTVNNDLWNLIDNEFVTSGPFSTNYTLATLSNGNMNVIFGDGIFGAVPPKGSSIKITWGDTLGPLGNIEENKIVRFDEPINNVLIYYSSPFTGGASPETIEQAKRLAPMLLRSLWRGVLKDDYAALTENYPGVKQASVLDINDYPLYNFQMSYHETWIVVIPNNDSVMSDGMRDGVASYLEERKYVTNHLVIIDADYVSIDVDVTLYKAQGVDPQPIEKAAIENINTLFTIARSPIAQYRLYGKVDGLVLGEDFRYSKLSATLQSIPNVMYLELSTPQDDVPMNNQQIPVLGELRINIMDAEGLI